MIKQNSFQHGFTLIEVMVVIVVAAIYIIALNQLQTAGLVTDRHAFYLSQVDSFIESETETLRNQGYNSIATGTTSLTSQLPSGLPHNSSASMTVTAPYTGIKQIDFTVTANSQTYKYTTYIGELGVGQ